mmetsp:Transcript_26050/g.59159  ORF Transcript_26050/g.59159 Transcript_26050/m.59159 type:complete len:177 (-) Transcript_26050:1022-1552(-)
MPFLNQRLREVARLAVNESLAGCSVQDFCDGFNLEPQHRHIVEHIYLQAQSKLRENSLAEFDEIFKELGIDQRLEQLECMLAERPELPDGSRCRVVSEMEGPAMVASATAAVKQQQKLAIMQAIQQVDQENEALQQQFHEQLPKLQAANDEIASCMAKMTQTATACEEWRRLDLSK